MFFRFSQFTDELFFSKICILCAIHSFCSFEIIIGKFKDSMNNIGVIYVKGVTSPKDKISNEFYYQVLKNIKLFDFCNLQIGVSESSIGCFELPKRSLDYGKNIAAYYYWLFPNLMLNFYPWGLSINIVFPLSKNQTKIVFRSYVWDESKLHVGAGADLNKVELEDEEIVQRVQKGVSSRFYNHGRFSPSMEQGVHHFHRLISRFMNG